MLIRYDTRDALMTGLADRVATELRALLAEQGQTSLSVPGGSTPRPFFEALREADLDWANVTICLNDERMVPESSDRSNTALVKAHLLQSKAAAAQFLNLLETPTDIADHLPLGVLVTGMGADMHTASLFPDAPQLLDALSNDAPPVLTISTPSGGEDRVTLTAPVLRQARYKHVLIAGADKLAAYETALMAKTDSEAPIRVVLEADPAAHVHYTE
ncbi:MAG: 6-phosphogluconolactonase [Pseudomonadota bacterium]